MEGGDGHHDPSLGPTRKWIWLCLGFIIFMGVVVFITVLLMIWITDDEGGSFWGILTFITWIVAAIFYWRSWFDLNKNLYILTSLFLLKRV